jgi:hypothetical protein
MHPDKSRPRERFLRTKNLGVGLIFIAAVLWLWCGALLTMSYDVDHEFSNYSMKCEARLFTDESTANDGRNPCADERDWPEALALLGLSVPISVTGAARLRRPRAGAHSTPRADWTDPRVPSMGCGRHASRFRWQPQPRATPVPRLVLRERGYVLTQQHALLIPLGRRQRLRLFP